MQDHVHRGARIPGLTAQPADRRILELDSAMRLAEVASESLPRVGMQRDSGRAAIARRRAVGKPGQFAIGTILHAFPYLHSYKVQLADGGGWVTCCATAHAGHIPMGPRTSSVYPPNSQVFVYMPPGLNYGYIIGSVPPVLFDGLVNSPDWLAQGSGAGLKREQAHKFPITGTYMAGGQQDFSANRPVDSTSLEHGWVSMFGGAMSIDDFMIMMRINEACGIWMHLHDSAMRIAGLQLTLESGMHVERAHHEEGELRLWRAIAAYPHESLGLYSNGIPFIDTFNDDDVHYRIHRGKIDLPMDWEDTEPVYRTQEHGGYLGQGFHRSLMKPAKESGKRRRRDAPQDRDEGLFRETVGLDGSFTLISAKRVHIGKRVKQIVPREVRVPEDPKGDDARVGGYKFSSLFGSGPDHKIKDPPITGDLLSARKAAAVNDFVAYLVNWQGVHPFHYHTKDFDLPQETDLNRFFSAVQDLLDFSESSTGSYMPDPQPVTIPIDHRYGDVQYFMRESFVTFHDDGTVQLACGYGAQILFNGGDIDIQAPHKVKIQSGTDVVVIADQIAARAKGSIDLSSTEHNVHIKAESMVQILGGNSGTGGILLESKANDESQDYANKYGEDVIGNGIVLKSANSVVGLLARDIYLRTGGADLGGGDIVLDAGKGQSNVRMNVNELDVFFNNAVQFFNPGGPSGKTKRVYRFDEGQAILDVTALVGGAIECYGENAEIVVRGSISATGDVACAGQMADADGGMVGKVPSGFRSQITSALAAIATQVDTYKPIGTQIYQTTFTNGFYLAQRVGNDDEIKDIGFSFRDPPNGDQYKVEGLLWPETRWQMMARLGLGTGGTPWTEKPVSYQGAILYPYPGKKKWTEDSIYLQLEKLTMFDADKRYDMDRASPYENPQIADWNRVVLDGTYPLIR